MIEHQNHDCLSPGDALFLHLERAGMPLHMASVCIFEGAISYRDCLAYIASKLPLLERYRQHVVTPPLAISLPRWQFDPAFDVRNHVREIRLNQGSDAELRRVASSLLSSPMDRRRPLWDLTMVSGLKGDRTAVIARVHHCLADGISGVGILRLLMEESPVAPRIPRPIPDFPAPPIPDRTTQLLDGVVTACFTAVDRMLTAQGELLDFAQHLSAAMKAPNGHQPAPNGAATPSPDLFRLLPELATPTERLPFNVVCEGPQKFHWAELPLAGIKALKHQFKVTVNDVVLYLIASMVRRYSELHGVSLRRRLLRVVVPVSVRGRDEANDLGNRITFVPVTMPLYLRDPRRLLRAIHQRTTALKTAHLAELVGLAGTLLGVIPNAFQALVGPIASQLPLNVCNLICTNVPGPQVPLYLLGHKMLCFYPYVPIGGEMGLNCAVLTYNGTAYFGFTADVHAVPDVALLPRLLHTGFADLQRAAGRATGSKHREHASPAPSPASAEAPEPVPPAAVAAAAA